MRTYGLMIMIVAVIVMGFAYVPAYGNGTAGFTFDENGQGTVPGVMLPDPTQPGNPLVLTYILPFGPVFSGDVRVWEDAAKTQLSDVIRFTNAQGYLEPFADMADRFIFYSEANDSDLADTGIPADLHVNDFGGVVEVNGEFFYAGYHGISDAVAEPSALALVGLAGLALRKRRS